jgi:hypothetical protein
VFTLLHGVFGVPIAIGTTFPITIGRTRHPQLPKTKTFVIIGLILNKKNATMLQRFFIWWAHLDSNQAPTDYESVALTE